MKVIIAGSRGVTDSSELLAAISESGFQISEVVWGCARGADALGNQWAKDNGVPVAAFPADWTKHGKAAGHIRNRQMGDYADALIALWDGQSTGTKGMIEYAKARGLQVHVRVIEQQPSNKTLHHDRYAAGEFNRCNAAKAARKSE